jgi:hypothetical protein
VLQGQLFDLRLEFPAITQLFTNPRLARRLSNAVFPSEGGQDNSLFLLNVVMSSSDKRRQWYKRIIFLTHIRKLNLKIYFYPRNMSKEIT